MRLTSQRRCRTRRLARRWCSRVGPGPGYTLGSGVPLVLNRRRARRGDALVVLRWSDWCELHGVPAGREMSAPVSEPHARGAVAAG